MDKLYNNILNSIKNYQIQDSKEFLELLNFQLKLTKYQLSSLENNKPYWFQKKKLKEYNQKRIDLQNIINNYRKIIEEEYDLNSRIGE